MAQTFSSAIRSWRALGGVARGRTIGLVRATGLTLALVTADAVTAPPAAAAPVAAARVAAARVTAATALMAPRTGKAKRKAAKGKAAKRKATRGRTKRAARVKAPPAPAAADLSTFAVPSVTLPEIVVTRDSATGAMVPARGTFAAITRSAASLLDGLVTRARSQLGTRYVYGGTEPGAALDCSSFAQYVMQALDIRLPRTAQEQARVGVPVPRDASQLRPGDLLTFGSPRSTSHVGIYLGEGRFIHASVSSGRVVETTIERNRALFRRWQGARRVLADGAPAADAAPAAAALGNGG